jgi:hypothetical protein
VPGFSAALECTSMKGRLGFLMSCPVVRVLASHITKRIRFSQTKCALDSFLRVASFFIHALPSVCLCSQSPVFSLLVRMFLCEFNLARIRNMFTYAAKLDQRMIHSLNTNFSRYVGCDTV